MKTVALVINANQNPVNAQEITKIKRGLRQFAPASEYKFVTYANDDAEDFDVQDFNEDMLIVINTSDVNGVIRASSDLTTVPGVYYSAVLN